MEIARESRRLSITVSVFLLRSIIARSNSKSGSASRIRRSSFPQLPEPYELTKTGGEVVRTVDPTHRLLDPE